MFKCQICNKEFEKRRSLSAHISGHSMSIKEYYDKHIKKEDEGICKCGKETKFTGLEFGYQKYCSPKCSNSDCTKIEKTKQVNLERYGGTGNQVKELKEKSDRTLIERYGVSHNSKIPEVIEKRKETWIENYGVDNPQKCKEIQEKTKLTNFQKYGGVAPACSKEIKDKIKQTTLKNFIPKLLILLDSLNLQIMSEYENANTKILVRCKKCQKEFKSSYWNMYQGYGKCPICFPTHNSSENEREIIEFIKSLDLIVEERNREILSNQKELDIYIPSLKIAIEHNGLYWHDENHLYDIKYHLNKTLECKSYNIKLIHIFEDEWNLKKDIVKSRLKQILNKSDSKKINARDCQILEVDPKTKDNFLQKFHIQGKDKSNVKLGAFYHNELVSIMTFSHGSIAKGSKNKDTLVWELNRFCSNSDFHVVGIAGKLLEYFKRNFEWKEIFSYADRRWSDGNLYYKLGFKLDKITKPNYWYVKYDKDTRETRRIYRFDLRKTENDPKNVPERILRIQEGYSRIWDCGNLKFVMKKET